MAALSALNLYLVTFNCGRALINPKAFASRFFDGLSDTKPAPTQPPDIVVIHLQEIAAVYDSFNGSPPYEHYRAFEAAVDLAAKGRFPASTTTTTASDNDLKEVYAPPITHHAGMTAIMLFVRRDLAPRVESVLVSDVGVGVQRMGNKGAAAIRMAWHLATSSAAETATDGKLMHLTFVSAHLAPMEEAVDRRNRDYRDIVSGLVFDPTGSTKEQYNSQSEEEDQPLLSDSQTESASASKLFGIYEPDTHLFFSGDLNYRTSDIPPSQDGSDKQYFPQPTIPSSSANHYLRLLLPRDQLTAQHTQGKVLHGLTESPITFPPTYKYSSLACGDKDLVLDSELTEWKWSTHRWPSWCDRIFYSPNPSYQIHKYTCLPLFATSDHRPVALSVSVPLKPVHNPDFASQRPVNLDPHWKANRNTAKIKEKIASVVLHTFTTTEGVVGIVTLAVAIVATYAITRLDEAAGWWKAPVAAAGIGAAFWAYGGWKGARWPLLGAVLGVAIGWLLPSSGAGGMGGEQLVREFDVRVETLKKSL